MKKALLIGSNYNLKYAEKEVTELEKCLKSEPYNYDCTTLKITEMGNANCVDDVKNAFREVLKDAKSFLFFYAGHALVDESRKDLIFLLHEEKRLYWSILLYELMTYNYEGIKDILFILDCCHAGQAFYKLTSFTEILQQKISFFAPTSWKSTVSELEEYESTCFGHELLEALKEKYDCATMYGHILISLIHNKLKDRLKANSPICFETETPYELGTIEQMKDVNLVNKRYLSLLNNLAPYTPESSMSYSVQTNYSNIPLLNSFQKDLFDKIQEELNAGDYQLYQEAKDHYFDAIQRPDFAYVNRAFYFFPFFLTPVRLNAWGVIPYASHKALGLIFNKEKYKNLETALALYVFNKEKKEQSSGKNHWLLLLISEVEKLKGKVYTVSGYMFSEIIPLIINQFGSMMDQEKYREVAKEVPLNAMSVKQYKERNKSKNENMAIEYMVWNKVKKSKKNVAIVDLASAGNFRAIWQQEKREDYVLMSLRHFLDIPVGIGFSLLAFNDIKKKTTLWKSLQNLVLDQLDPCRSELAEIGIVLNELNKTEDGKTGKKD